jgi:hypothetical protein
MILFLFSEPAAEKAGFFVAVVGGFRISFDEQSLTALSVDESGHAIPL